MKFLKWCWWRGIGLKVAILFLPTRGRHARKGIWRSGMPSVDGALILKVVATKHAYGWTAGSYVLIEVPEVDVVTTVDGIEDDDECAIAVMDAARGAVMAAAENNGGIGADGSFAIDLEWGEGKIGDVPEQQEG